MEYDQKVQLLDAIIEEMQVTNITCPAVCDWCGYERDVLIKYADEYSQGMYCKGCVYLAACYAREMAKND